VLRCSCDLVRQVAERLTRAAPGSGRTEGRGSSKRRCAAAAGEPHSVNRMYVVNTMAETEQHVRGYFAGHAVSSRVWPVGPLRGALVSHGFLAPPAITFSFRSHILTDPIWKSCRAVPSMFMGFGDFRSRKRKETIRRLMGSRRLRSCSRPIRSDTGFLTGHRWCSMAPDKQGVEPVGASPRRLTPLR